MRQRAAAGERLPPGYAARRVAVDILISVLERGRPAGAVLDAAFESSGGHPLLIGLPAKDRALVRAIVAATLRHKGEIDDALKRFLRKAPPQGSGPLSMVLRAGAAQLLFLDVPDHAAVTLAVETAARDRRARRYSGLVNAVLRALARAREEILAAQDGAALSTPSWLMARWSRTYGAETARAIALAHLVEPALDLTVRADAAGWARRLGGIVLPTGTVRLLAHGPVDRLEGFTEGAWWVQDAAAALPARLLGDVAGWRVADLCAAPGGKTAQLAAAGAHVTAVDISEPRLARLRGNLERLGLTAASVAADALTWQPEASFDAVLIDAPCSSTGTIRRHPDVQHLKRESDVAALGALQRALLDRAIEITRPGGTIVYSTCSLEPEEGEALIEAALAAGAPIARRPVTAAEIGGLAEAITPAGDLRTLPCHLPHSEPRLSGLDGFFAARLVRQ